MLKAVYRSVGRLVDQSVCLCVCLSARFLSNCGCGGYQTWICGYVQRALGTASLERRCQTKACLRAVSWFSGFPILEQVTNI